MPHCGSLKVVIMSPWMKVTRGHTVCKAARSWLFLWKPWPLWDGLVVLPYGAGIALSTGPASCVLLPCLAPLGKLRHIRGLVWDQSTYLSNAPGPGAAGSLLSIGAESTLSSAFCIMLWSQSCASDSSHWFLVGRCYLDQRQCAQPLYPMRTLLCPG